MKLLASTEMALYRPEGAFTAQLLWLVKHLGLSTCNNLFLLQGSHSSYTEPETPVDYEAFIAERRDELLADPEKHLVLFPEEDVEVFTITRSHRTVEPPLPGAAKRSTDLLVQECVQGFITDWHSIKRK